MREIRGRWRRPLLGLGVAAGAFAATARPALAHEKWFRESSEFPLRWDLLFRPLPLAFVAAVLLAVLAVALLWRSRGGRGFLLGPEALGATEERRALFYGLVPLILGVHVAVPLLVNGLQGNLFSPDNELPGVWANFLGFAETGIALALFYGLFTRVAASALVLLWLTGLFVMGPQPMLDNAFFLGFAAFFFLVGRGPYALDRLLLPRLEPPAHLAGYALPTLRIGLGLSFVVVAFTEKLANIPLGLAFLEEYPLNFTGALGIPLSDEVFVLCAGAVELLVGMLILFGLFPRETVLVALVPINLTLTVFNWTELVGHLPIYGVLAVLLIWGRGDRNPELWTKGLREGPLAADESLKRSAPTGPVEVKNGDRIAKPNG
ncbi:hypothetical protein BH18ACT10_BH18ACT10_04490 [soil metagenome]|nr:DoxX family membrane protein [Rubrobacter sp.]